MAIALIGRVIENVFFVVGLIHSCIGNVDPVVLGTPRIFRIPFRGNANQPIVVEVDKERIQTGQEHVHSDVKLEMKIGIQIE